MNLFDHLLVIVFAVIYPIAGFIGYRRLLKRAAAGTPIDRNGLYSNTMLNQWILFFAVLLIWANTARPWSTLGFDWHLDRWFFIALGLTVAGIVLLLVQVRQTMRADKKSLADIRAQIGKLALMVPQNGNELTRFYLLSVTAGIVEEILWRGFLIWYLSLVMPLWAAALVSTVGFGLAHAYQGLSQLPKVTLVGGAFAGLYLLSGSIWLPMLLHAAVDILQGRLVYEALHRKDRLDYSPGEEATEPTP